MVTITDIANRAGVAKSTVSRYLNGGSVSKKTKSKLDQIVEETGYKPNTFARSLKAKRTNMIGTIIPRLDSYSANEVLSSIDEALRKQDYQLLITNSNLSPQREIENIYALAKQKVAGILLMATVVTEEHRKAIANIEVPVILLGQQAEGLHSIVHQEYEAGFKMGKYAVSLGHRSFLYFTVFEEDVAVGKLRKQGVLAGLQEAPDAAVEILETSFSFQEAYQTALKVLPETSATYILCATDNIALAVLKAAHTLGMTVPGQFSLSGFGGYEVTSVVTPTVTTVRYSYKELGKVAVEYMTRILEKEAEPKDIRLGNELIENQSTKRRT